MIGTDRIDNYPALIHEWERVRTCLQGQTAVKQDEELLPRPDGMTREAAGTDKPWEAYRGRAHFYGVSRATVSMLSGLVERVPPEFEAPAAVEPTIEGRTAHAQPLGEQAMAALGELLSAGRVGGLVEMPEGDSASAEPYVVLYDAEEILRWTLAWVDGAIQPVEVWLDDPGPEDPQEDTLYRRELILLNYDAEDASLRQYVVDLVGYRIDGAGEETEISRERTEPLVAGRPIPFIPFVVANDWGVGFGIRKYWAPPLLPLVNAEVQHYRVGADLYHHLHRAAGSQPYVVGVDPEDQNAPKTWGGSKLWFIPENGSAGVLAPPAEAYEALSAERESLEDRMAVMGAHFIRSQVNRQETAEAARMREGGQTSALRRAVGSCSRWLEALLGFAARLKGVEVEPGSIVVTMNTDFVDDRLTGAELANHVKAWLSLGGGEEHRRELYRFLRERNALTDDAEIDALIAERVRGNEEGEERPAESEEIAA